MATRNVLDDVLEHHHFVGGPQKAIEANIDFRLPAVATLSGDAFRRRCPLFPFPKSFPCGCPVAYPSAQQGNSLPCAGSCRPG